VKDCVAAEAITGRAKLARTARYKLVFRMDIPLNS